MSTHTIISFRPQNVVRQLEWHFDSKVAVTVLPILLIFTFLAWGYLTQASAVTTTTYQIDGMRLELDQLRNQNAELVLEIAQLESLSRVESRARNLGFAPTTQVEYIQVETYPALDGDDIAPYRGSERARGNVDTYSPQTQTDSWWVGVLDDVVAWVDKK
ncbi:septum formation initiator family protein [Anaerolineales bacterium HSG6]|nr:septum formation initiator family protein [Anaerolineales bacterium HSG6]